ncbi:hypothetical protein ACJX0J_013841, partial [Zea mays]
MQSKEEAVKERWKEYKPEREKRMKKQRIPPGGLQKLPGIKRKLGGHMTTGMQNRKTKLKDLVFDIFYALSFILYLAILSVWKIVTHVSKAWFYVNITDYCFHSVEAYARGKIY